MSASAVMSAAKWVGKLATDEVKYLYGVRDKVQELRQELEWMQLFLVDADSRLQKEALIRKWVSDIKELAYDAEDVLEKFVLRVSIRERPRHLFSCATIKWFSCLAPNAIPLHEIGSEIDSLISRLSKLSSRLQSYGVKMTDGEVSTSTEQGNGFTRELRRTYSHQEQDMMIGLEANISELSRVLKNDDQHKMVAICGMGGLGKTTLARKVYHDDSVRQHFQGFAWAYISRKFETSRVIRGILLTLIPESDTQRRANTNYLDDDRLYGELHQMLQEKRCLVVLDDVWRPEDWSRLQAAFPMNDPNCCSRVILTTRNKNTVAGLGHFVLHHDPKLLDMDQSRDLLQRKVPIDPSLSELATKMLKHCNGLPLAIVVLGGVLANKRRTPGDWQDVLNNIHSYFRDDKYDKSYTGVYNVLGMSYYDLPYHLKPCFLHLGSFPRDFKIRTKKLYRMWIAEGIVTINDRVTGTKSLEEVAEVYLNELIERKMVQVGNVDEVTKIWHFTLSHIDHLEGKTITCRLHDLWRDVSLMMGKQEKFVRIIGDIHGQSGDDLGLTPILDKNMRRLTVYVGQDLKSSLSSSLAEEAPSLRSLVFFRPHEDDEENAETTKWVRDICHEFQLLRVVDIEGLSIRGDLPPRVGNLIYLRYLNLRGTGVTSLPSSIGNLRCLETLDLRVNYGIKLPNVLCKLQKLRHLYFPYRRYISAYEIENGELLRLDGLSLLKTLKNLDMDSVAVEGLLGLRSVSNVSVRCDTISVKESWMPFLNTPSIKRLSLKIGTTSISPSVPITSEYTFMLSSCQSLLHLMIHNYDNFELHRTLRLQPGMFPKSLVTLFFQYCGFAVDPMPILEHQLPHLKYLAFMGSKPSVELMVCSAGGFPELSYLGIFFVNNLMEWRLEKGSMPKLEKLDIYDTPIRKLPESLPSGISIKCNPCVPGIERFGTCPYFTAVTDYIIHD